MKRWGSSGQAADSFYQVRPDCSQNVPNTKFKIKAGKTLSVRKWHAAFTRDGCLDIASVLSRIQRGGVHPTIRGEVWEFLLGCFDPGSTFDERDQIRERRRMQYARWKEECKEMDSHVGSGKIITAPIITEDGFPIKDPLVLLEATSDTQGTSIATGNSGNGIENRVLDKQIIDWKLTLHQIGLDVLRTDRTMVFYENKDNISKLWDILAVYAWIDKEVGYCQGMSDLCSPMIVLLHNEADAFWCFERLMRRLRGNFRCTQQSVGVENQLQHLASIIQVLDPKLHGHLERLGGGDYLFAFRMFMVLFRRELSFGDSLYLWEMMWALEYDPGICSTYEEDNTGAVVHKIEGKVKSIRQFGKYERENMKKRANDGDGPVPISVFLVASVLKENSTKLLQEARGIDDIIRILNNVNGNLDAKRACVVALKLHRKYHKKEKKS
ncbi:TBC domain containing protein isoform X1 [Zea mays]|uniref:Ypt/Rab-GAP domain of gyp1p superfamily protein n=1 Tax=Zea mays TaxID=4577 RepID=B4FMY4_MAIZE|nr:TBC domain containing protein isoform X1 [Zea mays]ACF83477.1 unknown [Zea mays]ONM11876.1 Ypt/Rab-GAP domain of gyp1p superfamily protein [Zea mays]|eukprot:XP_008676147.1 TBC domain containing protein isoform X1 [Zea mays]